MKKILLFVFALALVGMTNAKEVKTITSEKVTVDLSTLQARVAEVSDAVSVDAEEVVGTLRAKRAAQAAEYDDVDWYFVPGQMHYGWSEGFMSYPIASIILPHQREIVWTNYYGATDWTLYDESVEENVDTTSAINTLGLFGAYSILPTTSDHDLVVGENTYKIKGTSYGLDESYRWLALAPAEHYINETENLIMTLCAMHTDTLNKGNDVYTISNSNPAYGKYFNGTGRILDLEKPDVTADTIGIIVENDANMKIDQIIFLIYNRDAEDVQQLIPNGAEIRLALFPVNGNTIDLQDTIASTVVTNASWVDGGAAWLGTVTAKFYETDFMGNLAEAPVYTGGSFYLQITNFNETGCDFGFFSDYYCPKTYTTVYQQDGKFTYLKNGGANLAIMFDGYYPTIVNDTTANYQIAPAEGGVAFYSDDADYSYVVLYSNVDPNEWDVEADEWLTVALDDSEFEQYDAVIAEVTAEALPEGETYREGTVTFYVDGTEYVLTIKQGTSQDPEAIDNVNDSAVKATKSFIDGQLIIERNGVRYNAVGAQIR